MNIRYLLLVATLAGCATQPSKQPEPSRLPDGIVAPEPSPSSLIGGFEKAFNCMVGVAIAIGGAAGNSDIPGCN